MRMFQRFAAVAALAVAALSIAPASADHLTPAQETTLRTAILAEPALAQAVAIRNDPAIADYCNTATTQKAWKTSYSDNDLFDVTDINVYIARSVPERQAYDLLITIGDIDPSKASIRSGIVNIFSGAGGAAQRAAILNDMTRFATWAEQKLGGVNATTDTVTAWRLNYSGPITASHVSTILNAGN